MNSKQTNDENAQLYFHSILYRYSLLYSRYIYTESLQYRVDYRSETE
jgi:hypothetical protein